DDGADGLHGHLAVLGGIADVLGVRALDKGKPLLEPRDDVSRLIEAERGLGEVAHTSGIGEFQTVHVLYRFDEVTALGHFAKSPDHLIVILVTDEHDTVSITREAHGLQVHFRHARACGVDYVQLPFCCLAPDGRCDPMGAEDGASADGDFVELLDKYRAGLAKFVDHVLVVYDLLADVNRRPVKIQSNLYD